MTICTTLLVWWKIYKITRIPITPLSFFSKWPHNPDFTINKSPLINEKWKIAGITHLSSHHLLLDNNLIHFSEFYAKIYFRQRSVFLLHTINCALRTNIGKLLPKILLLIEKKKNQQL